MCLRPKNREKLFQAFQEDGIYLTDSSHLNDDPASEVSGETDSHSFCLNRGQSVDMKRVVDVLLSCGEQYVRLAAWGMKSPLLTKSITDLFPREADIR